MTGDDLQRRGFAGFIEVGDCRPPDHRVPAGPGTYAVLRTDSGPPVFLSESPGSWFKRKDPKVSIERLQAEWVSGASVLYIGSAASLRDRTGLLREFADAGPARSVFHWGGRLLWQVEGWQRFLIAWKPTDRFRQAEAALIDAFVEEYGSLPFANLQRPRGAGPG